MTLAQCLATYNKNPDHYLLQVSRDKKDLLLIKKGIWTWLKIHLFRTIPKDLVQLETVRQFIIHHPEKIFMLIEKNEFYDKLDIRIRRWNLKHQGNLKTLKTYTYQIGLKVTPELASLISSGQTYRLELALRRFYNCFTSVTCQEISLGKKLTFSVSRFKDSQIGEEDLKEINYAVLIQSILKMNEDKEEFKKLQAQKIRTVSLSFVKAMSPSTTDVIVTLDLG